MNGLSKHSSSFRKIFPKGNAVMPQGSYSPSLPETTADGAKGGPSCRAVKTAGARPGRATPYTIIEWPTVPCAHPLAHLPQPGDGAMPP
jgi:hypothetical protein